MFVIFVSDDHQGKGNLGKIDLVLWGSERWETDEFLFENLFLLCNADKHQNQLHLYCKSLYMKKKITLSLQFLCEIVYEYFDKSSFQQERLETQLWSQEGQFTTIALGASQLKHWPSDHFWVKFLQVITIKSFITVLWRNESVIVLHYNVKVFVCWDIFPCLTWCHHCMSVLS